MLIGSAEGTRYSSADNGTPLSQRNDRPWAIHIVTGGFYGLSLDIAAS